MLVPNKKTMNSEIKILINNDNDFFKAFISCLNITPYNNNTVKWNQDFCPNVNILIGNKFRESNANAIISVFDYHYDIDGSNGNEKSFNKFDFVNISTIKFGNQNDLLKDTKFIEDCAVRYLGKYWYKSFESENKYSMCIEKLANLFDEVLDECGFSELVESLKNIIKLNYINYLVTNNFSKFDSNGLQLSELLNFCNNFNVAHDTNLLDNSVVRINIEKSLEKELSKLKSDSITLVVDNLNYLHSDPYIQKLNELDFSQVDNKRKELLEHLDNHLKNDTVKNIEEFYILNDNINKLNLPCDTSRILYSNNVIHNLCSFNVDDSKFLLDYVSKLNNFNDILLSMMICKIHYVFNSQYNTLHEKTKYFLDLCTILDKSQMNLDNEHEYEIKFFVKKYLDDLLKNKYSTEGTDYPSLELEKLYFCNNENANNSKIYTELYEKLSILNSRVDTLENEFSSMSSLLNKNIDQLDFMESKINKFDQIMVTFSEQFNNDISNTNNKINKLDQTIASLSEQFNNESSNANDKIIKLDQTISSFSEQFNNDLISVINKVDKLNQTTNSLSKQYTSAVNYTSNKIDKFDQTMTSFSEQLNNGISNTENKISSFTEQFNNEISSANDKINKFDHTISNFSEQFSNKINSTVDKHNEQLDDFETKLDSYQDSNGQMINNFLKVTTEMGNRVEEIQNKFNEQLNQFETKLNGYDTLFKTMNDNAGDNFNNAELKKRLYEMDKKYNEYKPKSSEEEEEEDDIYVSKKKSPKTKNCKQAKPKKYSDDDSEEETIIHAKISPPKSSSQHKVKSNSREVCTKKRCE